MKKRLSMLLAAVAMLATGAASMGCVWWVFDEPSCNKLFKD